jgi:hypothetical protein
VHERRRRAVWALPRCSATTGAVMAERLPVDVENLLLGLAWLGEASTSHIGRLWLPGKHATTVQRLMVSLLEMEYVTRRRWSLAREVSNGVRAGGPLRQDTMWGLDRRGREAVREHDAYPLSALAARHKRLLPHDTQTAELLVRAIELGRPAGLSGVYVEREVRLDPPKRRPIMDALLVLRTGGGYDRDDTVPWTRDPHVAGEKRRRYAVENDRGSEAISVIVGKAVAYQAAGSREWLARYGRPFPTPLWLVPNERRLKAILNAWRVAWPRGRWIMTTDAWLAHDRWVEYVKGATRERGLFQPQVADGEAEVAEGGTDGR